MDSACVYIVHDARSGWMKLGWSGTPYARLYNLRRDYPELKEAEIVGFVRTKYYEQLEYFLWLRVHDWVKCFARGQMNGERFRIPGWGIEEARSLLDVCFEETLKVDHTASALYMVPRIERQTAVAAPKKLRQPRMPKMRRPYVEQRLREIAAEHEAQRAL